VDKAVELCVLAENRERGGDGRGRNGVLRSSVF
jgi:hypothetical protein